MENFDHMLRSTPAYAILLGNSEYEILSALSLGASRWTCRVRVKPSEASQRCLARTAVLQVGQRVQLTRDFKHLERAFELTEYAYSAEMADMAGAEFEILSVNGKSRGTSMVGLPSPDGSQDGVWFFPSTVFERDDGNEATSGGDGLRSASCEYRWELSRQSEAAPRYDLGMLLVHKKYAYRGVIVGYDEKCLQDDDWIERMGVDKLERGRDQPFYHVLVDSRDRPGDQITYVAQENVERPSGAAAMRGFPEPILHQVVPKLLLADSFDPQMGGYAPRPELRTLYPRGVAGCWLVDSVMPD